MKPNIKENINKLVYSLVHRTINNNKIGGSSILYMVRTPQEAEGFLLMTVLNAITGNDDALPALANLLETDASFTYKQLMRGAFQPLTEDELQDLLERLEIDYSTYSECIDFAKSTYFGIRRTAMSSSPASTAVKLGA
jgi:hypothetical protein